MAPEMVILMHERKRLMYDEISSGRKPRPPRQKYNKCVDWWSLGVTMYTLLTGSRPFRDDILNEFVTMILSNDINQTSDGKQYAALFQEIGKQHFSIEFMLYYIVCSQYFRITYRRRLATSSLVCWM